MADAYIPTVEEIAELRQAVLDSYQAGSTPGARDWSSDWARERFFEPDGGTVDIIDTLAATRARIAELEAPGVVDRVAQRLLQVTPVTQDNAHATARLVLRELGLAAEEARSDVARADEVTG